MKKALINTIGSLAIALVTLACVGTANAAEIETPVETTAPMAAVETATYGDVEGHWAEEYIEVITDLGLMVGYEDGNFHPNDTITEAEALVVFFRSTGYFAYGQVAEAAPTDGVPAGQWYSDEIGGLQAAGLLNRKIAVNGNISRQDFTVLAARTLGYTEVDEDVAKLADTLYTDIGGMTIEQKYSAVVTNNEGVVYGIGNNLFDCGTLSRGEAATIIYRMMEAIGVIDADDGNITDTNNDNGNSGNDDHDDRPSRPDPDDDRDDDSDNTAVTIEGGDNSTTGSTEIVTGGDGEVFDDVVDIIDDDVIVDVEGGETVTIDEDNEVTVVEDESAETIDTTPSVSDGEVYDDVVDIVTDDVTVEEIESSESVEITETETTVESVDDAVSGVVEVTETVSDTACSVVADGSVSVELA